MPSNERASALVASPRDHLRGATLLHGGAARRGHLGADGGPTGAPRRVRRRAGQVAPALGGLLVAAAVALAPPRVAGAMEIRTSPGPFGRFVIHASGSIREGDAERFREALSEAGNRRPHLSISSGGGLVREAAAIAEMIASARMPVAVGQTCASACFMLLAASPDRSVGASSRVGVHRAYNAVGETTGSLDTSMDLARYAASRGVPAPILARMVTTPGQPTSMYWLSADDLRTMNVKIGQPPGGAATASAAPAATPASAAVAHAPGVMANAGRADRVTYRRWFNGLSESGRQGAVYWMRQRHLPRPGSCMNSDAQFSVACFEAQGWWAKVDERSRDPEYRRAWEGV